MITHLVISLVVGAIGFAAIYFGWNLLGARRRKADAEAKYERAIVQSVEQAQREKDALEDPNRIETKEEVANALREISARGRDSK